MKFNGFPSLNSKLKSIFQVKSKKLPKRQLFSNAHWLFQTMEEDKSCLAHFMNPG